MRTMSNIGRFLLALLAAAASFCADAQIVTVDARGKDQKTAETNAKISATRQLMLAITDEEFVKQRSKAIRNTVISRADDFVSGFKIVKTAQDGKSVEIRADVDVNRGKLAEHLKSLGAVIVPAYQEIRQQRQDEEIAALKAALGEGFKYRPDSHTFAPLNSLTSATEELEPGAELAIDAAKVASGDIIRIHYHLPEYSDLARKARQTMIALTPSDTPDDFESSQKAHQNERMLEITNGEGFTSIRAPIRAGAYELRLFVENRDKQHVLLNKAGFTVENGELARISIQRDRFLPEEKFFVQIEDPETSPYAEVYLTSADQSDIPLGQLKDLERSRALKEYGSQGFVMTAPKEAGDYSLLIYDFCDDCAYYEKNSKTQPASAKIDFKVVNPPASAEKTFVALPAEIYSGGRAGYIVGCDGAWKSGEAVITLKKKGAEKELYRQRVPCHEKSYYHDLTGEIFELGEYEAALKQGEGENEKTVRREFRVVQSPYDRQRKPGIYVEDTVAERDSGITVYGSALTHWPQNAFVALVPKGHSREIADVLQYTGDNRVSVGNGREFMVNFSINREAGDYELRLYDSDSATGKMQAAVPMRIMTDAEMKAHRQKIKTSIDSYLSEPDSESDDFKENFLKRFHMPSPPKEASLVKKTVAELDARGRANLPMTPAALKDSDCRRYIDEEIRRMSFVDITLGRDGDFENELVNFGKTVAFNLPLSDGTKLKKVYDEINETRDIYNDTVAGLDQISEEDYLSATKTAAGMILKGALNHCDEKCITKLVYKKDPKYLRDRMAQMSDAQYMNTYKVLENAIGGTAKGKKMLKSLSDYRASVAKSIKNLDGFEKKIAQGANDARDDVATLAGSMAGGNYSNKQAYADAVLAIAGTQFPIAVGSVKLSYQAYLSTKDFVRDVSVMRMYGKWKKTGGDTKGSLGYEDFARIWKEDWQHHKDRIFRQAKEVMVKTLGNELTKKALSKANRSRARMYLETLRNEGDEAAQEYLVNSDFISDEEVYDFLENQFRAWEEAERNNKGFARKANDMKSDFLNLKSSDRRDCRKDFNRWHQGIVDAENENLGLGTRIDNYLGSRVSSLWNKGCPDEVSAFKSYIKARMEIESELKRWTRGSKTCKSKNIRERTNDMICAMAKGRDHYLEEAAQFACDCDVESIASDGRIVLGKELERYKREAEIVNVMTQLDNSDVLHCLCNSGRVSHGHASSTVAIMFNPGATGLAPGGKCGENQRGACFASGWSCWHFTMPTDAQGLERCGYYKTLKNARDMKLNRISSERMCTYKYDEIMKKAREKEKEKKRKQAAERSRT